ncbi:MAG: histidine kinase [Bacteroidales bacterium]|jgi:hypothetical protein|nr:histidine kinase [Bacteroidales bacterium]
MAYRNYLTTKTAFWLSISITAALQIFFLISFNFREQMLEILPSGMPLMEHKINYVRFAISTLFNFILLFSLYLLNFRLLKSDMEENKKMTLVMTLSLLVVVVFSLIFMQIQVNLFNPSCCDFKKPIKGHFLQDLFLMLVVVFTSQIFYLSQKKQQIALKYEALQAENMKVRYEALKSQIDPHFFFNTLSSLYFLIETDGQKAQDYIHKFSSVFRYTLQNKEVVTLSEEVDFTKDYASLIQIRYGEQLRIVFEIDEKYGAYEIVPLSIQTLVENAIKHNIISNKQPLTVTVRSNPDDTVTVSNNLQTKETAESGAGIGLSNLNERYGLKWQKGIDIQNNGITFSVTVPLMATRI